MAGFLNDERPVRTLRDTLSQLKSTYCGSIGFEVCIQEIGRFSRSPAQTRWPALVYVPK